jgi:hypothetical protein
MSFFELVATVVFKLILSRAAGRLRVEEERQK